MRALISRPDRLETLSEISRAVSATLDLHQLYETIYTEISRVMDATLFSITIYERERGQLYFPYIREEGKLFRDQWVPFGNNVTSVVIEHGQALRFNSNAEYQDYAADNGLPTVHLGEDDGEALMFVPLHTGSRTIGTLSVESKHSFAYVDEDLETLAIIASQAAIAIENARLYADSQDSIRQMQALLYVAQAINQSLGVAIVLDAILAAIREVMPYAFAAIMLPDMKAGTLEIARSIGPLSASRAVTESDQPLAIPFGTGVTGTVFARGEPIIVPDVRAFPGFIDHDIPGVLSEIAVPLKRGDSVTGVLDVGREGVNAFTPAELNLLSLFASQAAIAVENARLFDEQRRRVDELQTIQSIVRELTPLHDLEGIASLICTELKRLIDYHACRIHLLEEDGRTLTPVSYTGAAAAPSELTIEDGFVGWIARHARADSIANTLRDSRPVSIPGTPSRPESLVGAPLQYEGRVRGVITLSKLGTDQFDENAVRLLEIIAAQVAIALDRARLYEQLRIDAITDPLVRLWNRRYLTERFEEERARAARNGRPLAAMMLDIDRFKLVNDTYGHDAGDVVLKELATLIRSSMRVEDIVTRHGGEEFCLCSPTFPQAKQWAWQSDCVAKSKDIVFRLLPEPTTLQSASG